MAVLTLAGYGSVKTYEANAGVRDSLLAENVEALAEEPEVQPQKCTKPIIYGSCYSNKDGMWQGTYVDKVEVYYVYPGSPIRCDHFYVHDCPSGTHRK